MDDRLFITVQNPTLNQIWAVGCNVWRLPLIFPSMVYTEALELA